MSPPDFSHLKPSDRVKRVPRVGDVVPMYADGSGGRARVVRADPDPTRPGFFKFYMDRDWSTTKVATGWSGDWELLLWPSEMFGVQPPAAKSRVTVKTAGLLPGDEVVMCGDNPWTPLHRITRVPVPSKSSVGWFEFEVFVNNKHLPELRPGTMMWTVDRPTGSGVKPAAAKKAYVPPTGDPEFPVFCLRCNGHSYMGLNRVEHKPGHGNGCPAR